MTRSKQASPFSSHFNVCEMGAVGDGLTLNTVVLQSTIDRCFEAGGGCIYFPPGVYLSGHLLLRSRVRLYLEVGAILRASPNPGDYPSFGLTCERRNTAFLLAIEETDIRIEGGGLIDGNGDAFFVMDEPCKETDLAHGYVRQGEAFSEKSGGIEDGPVRAKTFADGCETRYGTLLLFIRCQHLSFKDIRIEGSANWCLHLSGCDRAVVYGLFIRNSLLLPNADCIDLANSKNVTVANCHLEAGDDGIAITPCADGYALAEARDIVVTNCVIQSRSCAIRVGYGIERISNCVFSNIVIRDSNRGIGIFIRNRQIIENILFSNIVIETRLHTGWWGAGEPIHISAVPGYTEESRLGVIRNIRFRDITARSENGVVVYASSDTSQPYPIQDIAFEGVDIQIVCSPLQERFGGNMDMRPAKEGRYQVFRANQAGLIARRVRGLDVRGLQIRWEPENQPPKYFTCLYDISHCL